MDNFRNASLYHHGILGQKWGVRNGPPYPLSGGDYTPIERYYRQKGVATAEYKKKHRDTVIRSDKDTLSTLSYDPNRTKNVDMFYAAYKPLDKHEYNALFNSPIEKTLYDEKGKEIGTGKFLKYRIDNSAKKDIKVASEDSGAKAFMELFKKDRNFYNFVMDEKRMQSYFVEDKYKFGGYREARSVLEKMRNPSYKPTSDDLTKAYRMFNYVIPYTGDPRGGKDVATNRAKFFNALQEAGYGAVLDTNDAIYGGFKATSPVIVFDMEQIVPSGVYQTKASGKMFSKAVFLGRKALGV